MGKIAFLFSGQGAQHAGMGMELYENFETVRHLFDDAEAHRPGTLQQLRAGSDEELRATENTQPCLYLADLAAALALRESGIVPDAVAGFSLGEIPALAFGGAYSPITGFDIAVIRGKAMGAANAKADASMAAIVKLDDATVEGLCAKYEHVYPVNYNCDGQLVVSGARAELDSLCADAVAAGGRAMPLNVSGAFHSPYMNEAAEHFGKALAAYEIGTPSLTVYSNCTAAPYEGDVRALMTRQINSPVRWKSILADLAAKGFDTFIECGAGMVLKKLTMKNIPGARTFAIENMAGLAAVKEALTCS